MYSSYHPTHHFFPPPTHSLIYLLTVLTATLRQSGARTNHRRASISYRPMKHTPLIPSPSILFRANKVTVRAPGSPQATAWKRRAFFSMASLPHLGTAARNQVIVSMTHHKLPAMVKKYRTMKKRVHTWERSGSSDFGSVIKFMFDSWRGEALVYMSSTSHIKLWLCLRCMDRERNPDQILIINYQK